jgi:hypothetical protein
MLALRPDLPRDADEWLAQALAIDREERFGNVRAMWNAFLATFDLASPNRAKTPSLWASAKRTIGRLAHVSDRPRPAPVGGSPSPPASAAPSARSGPPGPDAGTSVRPPAQRKLPSASAPPRRPPPEPTMEISDSDITEAPEARPAAPPPPRRRVVEKTVELSDGDLQLQDSTPEAPLPEPATTASAGGAEQPALEAEPPAEERASEEELERQRKRERNRRKKQRKKSRKR